MGFEVSSFQWRRTRKEIKVNKNSDLQSLATVERRVQNKTWEWSASGRAVSCGGRSREAVGDQSQRITKTVLGAQWKTQMPPGQTCGTDTVPKTRSWSKVEDCGNNSFPVSFLRGKKVKMTVFCDCYIIGYIKGTDIGSQIKDDLGCKQFHMRFSCGWEQSHTLPNNVKTIMTYSSNNIKDLIGP